MPTWRCLAQSRVHHARPLLRSSSRLPSAAMPPRGRRTSTSQRRRTSIRGACEQVGRADSFGDCDLYDDAGLFDRQHRPAVHRTCLWRTAVGQYRVGFNRVSRRHRGRLAYLWTAGRHAGTQAALPGWSRGLHTRLGGLRGCALTRHTHRRALLPRPGCGRHPLRQRRHDHALVPGRRARPGARPQHDPPGAGCKHGANHRRNPDPGVELAVDLLCQSADRCTGSPRRLVSAHRALPPRTAALRPARRRASRYWGWPR